MTKQAQILFTVFGLLVIVALVAEAQERYGKNKFGLNDVIEQGIGDYVRPRSRHCAKIAKEGACKECCMKAGYKVYQFNRGIFGSRRVPGVNRLSATCVCVRPNEQQVPTPSEQSLNAAAAMDATASKPPTKFQ